MQPVVNDALYTGITGDVFNLMKGITNMSKTTTTLKIAGAIAVTAIATSAVAATQNPFQVASLEKGYMVASADKAKEAKCGGKKTTKTDGKTTEAKCGASKPKLTDGKCGEGKCGGKM